MRGSLGLIGFLALLNLPLLAPLWAITPASPTVETPSSRSGQDVSTLSELDTLRGLVHTYLETKPTDVAAPILQRILSHPGANVPTVTRLIAEAHSRRPAAQERHANIPVVVHGRSFQYAVAVPASYQPTMDYPLVICLHGAGFTGEAYLDRWESRLGEQYILACPTLMEGTWWTRTAEDLVLSTLRSVQERYRIDPDRVFLTGMSNGGIGTYLIGVHHPQLFAGLAPMASGLDTALLPLLQNLEHTPLYVIHGTQDQVMPVELSRSMAAELRRLGVPFVYREHDRVHPMAGGHFFPREELPALVSWFGTQRRERLPHRITLIRDASHLTASGWVRIDATDRIAFFTENLVDNHDETIVKRIYARIDGEVTAPNHIEVRTERVRRYTLYFNEELVDLSQPVTVVTNGKVSHEGILMPSVETLLRDARLRQEPAHLFPVMLTIGVES